MTSALVWDCLHKIWIKNIINIARSLEEKFFIQHKEKSKGHKRINQKHSIFNILILSMLQLQREKKVEFLSSKES